MNFTQRDRKLIEYATSFAYTSQHDITRVGAVIADGKSIVACGINSHQSHPMQKRYNIYRNFRNDHTGATHHLHAEIAALIKVRWNDLSGMSIYVTRVLRDGSHGIARPCPACMAALKDHKINKIYYTTATGIAYEEINR